MGLAWTCGCARTTQALKVAAERAQPAGFPKSRYRVLSSGGNVFKFKRDNLLVPCQSVVDVLRCAFIMMFLYTNSFFS